MVMRLLIPALMLTACAPIGRAPPPRYHQQPAQTVRSIPGALLAAHNRERSLVGSLPLVWDPGLAAGASAYANQLARDGRLRHSPRYQRPDQGENLWIGTRGAYPLEAMVGSWAAERRHFHVGRFPANSRTGRWSDVGHFTAMIWPTTRRVGCSLGRSARWDVLVCRYWPSGNVDGVVIGGR